MTNETLGTKLLALKERSGLSLTNIAKAANYRNASSIQRYFNEDYDAEYLPKALAERIHTALVGFGEPPIKSEDIRRLTEYGFLLDRRPSEYTTADRFKRVPQDHINVNTSYDAHELEPGIIATSIVEGDPIMTLNRPEHLRRRSVEATYISTPHMVPRYMPGEVIFFEHGRPALIGQDVVVALLMDVDEDDGPHVSALMATLVSRDAQGVDLKLLNPARLVRLENDQFDAIWPILSAMDLLSPTTNA